jgi:hypothetical protein
MRWRRVRALVGFTCISIPAVSAQAQPIATTTAPREHAHPHGGLGAALAFGVVSEPGRPTGWIARLDYDVLPVLGLPGRFGGVFGFAPGLQYWRAGGDWGIGMPVGFVLGVRGPWFRATGGFGFEAILVDQVADDTGAGFFAPFGHLALGLDLRGWRAGVEGRVTRRWQFGADDRTQWQATFFVGRTIEAKPDKRSDR